MRLDLIGGTLKIKSTLGKSITVESRDIDAIYLMSGPNISFPTALLRLFSPKILLKYAILSYRGEVTTISEKDSGFYDALSWLADIGWNIRNAETESINNPHTRVAVLKR